MYFEELIENQFDFYSYCLRKMVLCAYVDMLNLEDHVKDHWCFLSDSFRECYNRKPLCNM